MKMKRSLVAASTATIIGVAGLGGIAAYAETNTTSTDPASGLVNAIASKFNLNKDEVQKVFDDQHAKMQSEREARIKEEVSQLVTDGKLTQSQADKINTKRAELEEEREANRSSGTRPSRDEMKTKMEAERTALKAWAKENGIDTQYLRYILGGGRHDAFESNTQQEPQS